MYVLGEMFLIFSWQTEILNTKRMYLGKKLETLFAYICLPLKDSTPQSRVIICLSNILSVQNPLNPHSLGEDKSESEASYG